MKQDTLLTAVETLADYHEKHPPKMAFNGSDEDEVLVWKQELREKLCEISGLSKLRSLKCEPEAKESKPEDQGDHTRQRVEIFTTPGYRMPFYVLRPKGKGPFVPIIAIHGHGNGMQDVAGIAGNEEKSKFIRKLNYDYGLQAVKKGYIVFIPEKRGFGERSGPLNDCKTLSTAAHILGMSVIGLHTWDNQRLIDYVHKRKDVVENSLGAIGLSGGGGGTMWLAAMDGRIDVAVISGHLCNFHRGHFGCICNAVPNLLEWAERSDIAGLIVPRPLLIESASGDQSYSRERTLNAYERVKDIYHVAGVQERVDIDLFDGGHEWSGRKAWKWLEQWLPKKR